MSGGAVWWWLLATLSISLATEDVSFSVNTKRHSHVVSDRFLSITIDPALLMDGEYSAGITKVMNLARGLAPAYVRLGSPASNRYQFLKAGTQRQHNASYAVTEAQWMILNDFAQKSGLEPIVCVNIMSRWGVTGAWDTRNLRDLVAYSDRRKYKLSWQLGYELQHHKHRFSGKELGNDLKTLRSILDGFPRYQQSKVLGPDVISTNDPADMKFLKDFFHTAGNALSAVTWHAFEDVNVTRSDEETNTLAVGENELAHKLGTEFTSKPLWIAESCQDPGRASRFEDGLSWAVKLGEAAKTGVQTVMKRPQIHNLQTPTPDYWVSFLHKTLVGEVVLANDWIPSGQVHMFSHCTNTRRLTTNVFVNDQLRYEEGSMTFFGVNWLSTEINVSLKLSSSTKRSGDVELHEYILTRDHLQPPVSSQAPKVLLNGRHLSLDFTGRLPILTPKVHHYTNKMVLTLPGSSVGFWVVSGAKVRACLFKDGAYQDGDDLQTDSWEQLLTRVRRSAKPESASNEEVGEAAVSHDESNGVRKKSIASSQIVMEIGNWEEDNSKSKAGEEITHTENNSEKDILDPSVATQRSSDGTATEVQIVTPEVTNEHLGNYDDENNATQSNHLEDQLTENTQKPKYRISKVLVVFENESGDKRNESHEYDKRALLVDEETVISDEKEFSRVSRALEKDAFTVPSISLSLLDVAALRDPLTSLKRLREKRWEQLQRKKLLAGQEYKKALSLKASMLFPKKLIPGVPKLSFMQPKVQSMMEQRHDYDYVTEEEEPEGAEYMQQYPSQAQWNFQGNFQNGKNFGKTNGGGRANYEQLWEVERGVIDDSHFRERHRHIRENADEIHMGIKEIAQRESPENTFAYGARNERVAELFSNKEQSHDRIPHFETKPGESTNVQCLGEADVSKRDTYKHEGGPVVNRQRPTHGGYGDAYDLPIATRNEYVAPGLRYTPQVIDYQFGNNKRDEATSRKKPSRRREQHRDRRHLAGAETTSNDRDVSVETSQSDVLAVDVNEAKERDRKDVSAETLAVDNKAKEHDMKDVSAATLAVDNKSKEHDMKDVSAETLAVNDNAAKEHDRKDVSAATVAVNDNKAKEHDRKDVSAATLVINDNTAKEQDRKDVSTATLAVDDNKAEEHDRKGVSEATLAVHNNGVKEHDRKDVSAATEDLHKEALRSTGERDEERSVISPGQPEANTMEAGTTMSMSTKSDKRNTSMKKNARKYSDINVPKSMERNVRDSDTDKQVNSPQTSPNEHLESAVKTDTAGKDIKKIPHPKVIPILKPIPLPKLSPIPRLPLPKRIPLSKLPLPKLIPLPKLPLPKLIPTHLDGRTDKKLIPLLPKLIPKPRQHDGNDEQKEEKLIPGLPIPKSNDNQCENTGKNVPKYQPKPKEVSELKEVAGKNTLEAINSQISSDAHALQGKVEHLVSDIKSKTHKKIEELEKKKLVPLLPKAKAILPSIAHLKETLKTQENSLKEKVEAIRDDAISKTNTGSTDHLQAPAETHGSAPEKRNSIESSYGQVKERLTMLMNAISNYPDKEPSIFRRSVEFTASLQNSQHVTVAKTLNVKPVTQEPETGPTSSAIIENNHTSQKPRQEQDKDDVGQVSELATTQHVTVAKTLNVKPVTREPETGPTSSAIENNPTSQKPRQEQDKDDVGQVSELATTQHVTVAKTLNVKPVTREPEADPVSSPIENNPTSQKPRQEQDKDDVGQVSELATKSHDGELQAQTHLADLHLHRKKRHTNYNVGHFQNHKGEKTHPSQHSKKRFLKIKELQLLDFPKNEENLNHRAKSTDYSRGRNVIHVHDGSASAADLRCVTSDRSVNRAADVHESNANIDTQFNNGHGSYKCVNRQDPLQTLAHDLSKISSDTDESEQYYVNYRTQNDQVRQGSVSSVEDPPSGKILTFNANRSKSWQLKNIDSNSWESGDPVYENVSGGSKSGNWHLIRPITHNKNKIDANKRSKRYVDLFSGEIDSDQFLNKRLSMVDSNSNQDVSKDKLERKLSRVEKIPRLMNRQKPKHDNSKISGNINREFKDWNLALSPRGLQIEAETYRNDVDRGYRHDIDKDNPGVTEHSKCIDDRKYATSLPSAFPSKEPRKTDDTTQKHRYSGTDEASRKLGFFGNVLKKICSLFQSIFGQTLK